VTGPADGAPHAFDFQLSTQDDLLPVHALGENDGGLAKLARERLARMERETAHHLELGMDLVLGCRLKQEPLRRLTN
jgi:hypothetical protein